MDASEVTPAGSSSVAIISGVYWDTYFGTSGRVPTKLISPLRMLMSCGSSSRRQPRSSLPIRVMRMSFLTVTALPSFGASCTMVRTLKMRNSLPYWVTRTCRKKTVPGESSLMQMARTSSTGDSTTSSAADSRRSVRRLQNRAIFFLRRAS